MQNDFCKFIAKVWVDFAVVVSVEDNSFHQILAQQFCPSKRPVHLLSDRIPTQKYPSLNGLVVRYGCPWGDRKKSQ